MTSRRFLLRSATALVALSLGGPVLAQSAEPMRVVATFSILGDMVERIGGDAVTVTTLVGPNGDTHVYQPTPAAARAVSEADVLIVNGLEFEGWLDRLIEAAEFRGTRVVATNGIEAIAYEEGEGHDDHHDEHADHDDHDHEEHAEHGEHDEHDHEEHAEHGEHDEHDHEEHAEHGEHDDHDHEEHAEHGEHDEHDHEEHAEHGEHDEHDHEEHAEHADHDEHGHEEHAGHDHDHGEFDPHAWQSLENAVTYVDNITAALAQKDADNAGTFYQNRAAYVSELEALDEEIHALLATLPEDRRTIVTSHDAFQYFGRDYDLSFLAPQGLSTESEASAQDVAGLIEQMRAEGIAAVFLENVTDGRLLEQIANETGASIGGTLYPGALSEPDGPAATYLDMMRHNATTLAEALGS